MNVRAIWARGTDALSGVLTLLPASLRCSESNQPNEHFQVLERFVQKAKEGLPERGTLRAVRRAIDLVLSERVGDEDRVALRDLKRLATRRHLKRHGRRHT